VESTPDPRTPASTALTGRQHSPAAGGNFSK
jgi:hypothetical protein